MRENKKTRLYFTDNDFKYIRAFAMKYSWQAFGASRWKKKLWLRGTSCDVDYTWITMEMKITRGEKY